jgi:hypothetical protein
MTDDEIVELIDRLSRPIFLFRMARPMVGSKPGADKRMKRAMDEMREILAGYERKPLCRGGDSH